MSDTFTSLDQLERVKLIACGSFGKVYLVKDKQGTLYALKQIHKVKIIMMRQTQHLRQEVEILRQIKNNFISKLFGAFQDQKYIYLVFEFVPGGELFYHLRKYERFPPEVARFYLAELTMALGYCHDSLGVIYRDLKPENVLLDKKGHVKMTDFGFAKQTRELTLTLLGTPEYIAPELIRQTGHHKSADWWSFGVLAYELLAGVPPFYDNDVNQIYNKILSGVFQFPEEFDEDAKDLITKLLNVDKDKRLGANLQTGTKDVRAHPFFASVNWNWIEKRLVKPPIAPEIKNVEDLAFWEDAAAEFVEDEEEIKEMVANGECAEAPKSEEAVQNFFTWVG